MIVLKYDKKGTSAFISHVDLLKHMSRIARRADIPVKYSQGFNPHALIFFSAPMVLGVSSYAEYVTIDTDMLGADVFARYNDAVPASLRATKFFTTVKNPNIQGKNAAADYVLPVDYFEFDYQNGFEISYRKKDQIVSEEVSSKILRLFNADGKLGVRLASGNNNLRVDRLANALQEKYGKEINMTDIVKTAQYVDIEGDLLEVDDYLTRI